MILSMCSAKPACVRLRHTAWNSTRSGHRTISPSRVAQDAHAACFLFGTTASAEPKPFAPRVRNGLSCGVALFVVAAMAKPFNVEWLRVIGVMALRRTHKQAASAATWAHNAAALNRVGQNGASTRFWSESTATRFGAIKALAWSFALVAKAAINYLAAAQALECMA